MDRFAASLDSGDSRAALDLLSRGQVRVTPLISRSLVLDGIKGFEIVANRRGRKVLINLRQGKLSGESRKREPDESETRPLLAGELRPMN